MWQGFPIRPPQASTIAQHVDHLYYFLTAIDLFFTFVIFMCVFYFAIKYRRSKHHKARQNEGNLALEITWTAIPLVLVVIIFLWSSSLYIRNARPLAASTEIFVIGKQWMWHIQHPEGPREIDELHIPVDQPIKLTMTSEDVIHDFGIPAFRLKQDVVPGRYTSMWFEATKTGRYHFFCDQYCGMGHSQMKGWIIVMPPDEYERWLASQARVEPMAVAGARVFVELGCGTCHVPGQAVKAPDLAGLFGKTVRLPGGGTATADDAYIRSQILNPRPLPGFAPIMPTFQGQISEEEILQLIAYLKSLGGGERKATQ
jgi:cytochrome c oxidase subunit II